MENKIEQAEKFLKIVNYNYSSLKNKWKKHLIEKRIDWDDDVFSDTILKVYEYIKKNGLKNNDEDGMKNYFFKSFVTNIKREQQYSRNAYRDYNVDAFEINDKQIDKKDLLENKIRKQIFDDWCVIFILQLVEKKFDKISFHCFRLYYILPKITYEKLREITKVKDCKKRVVTIKNWLKENLNKKDLEKKFSKHYDND